MRFVNSLADKSILKDRDESKLKTKVGEKIVEFIKKVFFIEEKGTLKLKNIKQFDKDKKKDDKTIFYGGGSILFHDFDGIFESEGANLMDSLLIYLKEKVLDKILIV